MMYRILVYNGNIDEGVRLYMFAEGKIALREQCRRLGFNNYKIEQVGGIHL